MLNDFLASLLIFFLLINPIGLVPIFLSLTNNTPAAYKQKMAVKGPVVAWVILLLFGYLGESILSSLGISLAAFRVGGGVLLGITGIRMVLEHKQKTQKAKAEAINSEELHAGELEDIAVFPLATLFIAGPGAITAMMLTMGESGQGFANQLVIIAALTFILTTVIFSFVLSGKIAQFLPEAIISVITRVLGMLIIALAMQFIFDGIKAAFAIV